MPARAKGAIQPKISGSTRKGSTIQKSAAAKCAAPVTQPSSSAPRQLRAPSSSQASGGSARNSTTGHDTGGCASAVAAPRAAASA